MMIDRNSAQKLLLLLMPHGYIEHSIKLYLYSLAYLHVHIQLFSLLFEKLNLKISILKENI